MMKSQAKKVPKLRFRGFSDQWNKKSLGEVTKIQGRIGYRGYTVEDIVLKGQGAITISPSNINDELAHFDGNNTYISWPKYEESPEIKIENGDILFVKTGSTVGKTAYVNNLSEKATINPQLVVLKNIKIQAQFLFNQMITKPFKNNVKKIIVGGAMPTLSQADLAKVEIFTPSLGEQKKIAGFLSVFDDKISGLEKKKDLLEKYKKGIMQKIFTQQTRFKGFSNKWQEKRLSDIAFKQNSPLTANGIEGKSGKYNVFGASGLLQTLDIYDQENEYIAIVKDGAGVGRITFCEAKSSVLGTLNIIKPKQGVSNKFLYFLLTRVKFKKYVIGSTIPHIYFKDYSKEKILLPGFEEQEKVADFLTAIDDKIELTKRELEQAKTWKKGLLQQMFV